MVTTKKFNPNPTACNKKEINLEKSSIWIPLKNSSDQHLMFIHLRILLFHYPYLLYVTHTTEAGKCMTIEFFYLFIYFFMVSHGVSSKLFYSTNSIAMNTRLSI